MGWAKQPPGAGSGGGWWLGALVPDGCLPWTVGVVAAVVAAGWAALS
jgi:hypothetical protein